MRKYHDESYQGLTSEEQSKFMQLQPYRTMADMPKVKVKSMKRKMPAFIYVALCAASLGMTGFSYDRLAHGSVKSTDPGNGTSYSFPDGMVVNVKKETLSSSTGLSVAGGFMVFSLFFGVRAITRMCEDSQKPAKKSDDDDD